MTMAIVYTMRHMHTIEGEKATDKSRLGNMDSFQ